MKIALVVTGFPTKTNPSRSKFNKVFATELFKRGYEIEVFYLRSITFNRKLFSIDYYDNILINNFSVLFPYIKQYNQIKYFVYISNKILKSRKFEADLVHAIGGNSSIFAYQLSLKLNVPFLIHFIGGDLNFDVKYYIRSKLFSKSIHSSIFIGFESKALEKIFISYFPSYLNKATIYRGTKTIDIKPNIFNSYSISFLFIGGFPGNGNEKGGFTLLESILLLNYINLEKHYVFYFGGPNVGIIKNKLKKITNPKIKIEVIGELDDIKLEKYYNLCDVVIIPSLNEGIPNVMWESLAHNKLLITTRVGGIPEIIENNHNGILINPNESFELCNIFLKIPNNLDFMSKIAHNGYLDSMKFDYSNFLDEYVKIYINSISDYLFHKKVNK